MKQILKDIIEDQKNLLSLRGIVTRDFPKRVLDNEQIVIITGVRRCGKSVLLNQIRKQMPQKDYFFNFDDDRLTNFTVENFQELYEVFIELYGNQDYFYFDEIQNIKGWEHFVKRLYNQGKKVFVTGSNANMLSKELGTLLTGCYVSIELYPFSFKEFLSLKAKDNLANNFSGTKNKAELQSLFESYLNNGGFPLYLKTGDDSILKTLYNNILYRDVMVRNRLTNEKEIKEMVYFVVSNIGKLLTYTSLSKVIGVKNSTTTKNYLDYVENTYLLFSVSKIDNSLKVQFRNPKKIYCIDNALALRLGHRFSSDMVRMLENLVFLEFQRRGKEVFYYNDGDVECDFVIRDGFKVVQALQVCYDLTDIITKEREINGLISAMNHFHLEQGFIITLSQKEDIVANNKIIHLVPCYQWLLDYNII